MLEQIASDSDSLAIACLSVVGIIAIVVFGVGGTLVSLVRTVASSRLKRHMLELGMSASEIEKVLKAGSDEFKTKWHHPSGKPPVSEDASRPVKPARSHVEHR